MTDLWYIKRNDSLHFDTLNVLKFTKKICPEISLLPAGTPEFIIIPNNRLNQV